MKIIFDILYYAALWISPGLFLVIWIKVHFKLHKSSFKLTDREVFLYLLLGPISFFMILAAITIHLYKEFKQ